MLCKNRQNQNEWAGDLLPDITMKYLLHDVPITILRPVSRNAPAGTEAEVVSNDYAHRMDRREVSVEIDGVKTWSIERQYIVGKDVDETWMQEIESDSFGSNSFGDQPFGGVEPNPLPVIKHGSQAEKGFTLRDDETDETFTITGITRLPDERNLVIHCTADQTRGRVSG